MNIVVLRNFLQVARTLHFTKASDKAFIAQPALSRQIKQLETEVGAVLFKRGKRNVVLTPAGEYFKVEVERIINQLEYAMKAAQRLDMGESGEVRIGYTHSAMQSYIPELLKYLKKEFPKIKTLLKEMTNTHQIDALRSREIDISISPNPVLEANVRHKILFKDNFAVVLQKDHSIDKSNFTGLSQFSQEQFILPPKTEGTLYVGLIESMCIEAGFSPSIIHETSHANTGIKLVEAGIGITIEPVSGLAGYTGIKYIELDCASQKAEMTMLWLPEFEESFPEIKSSISQFQYTKSH